MKPVAFLFLLALIAGNARAQWTQTSGPIGAKSQEIFYLKNYLFVNGYDGGVYRSADKGLTWEPVNSGLPVDFRCYAMDVENNKVFITTSNGSFFSDDLGNSWQPLTSASVSIEVSGDEIFVGPLNNEPMRYSPDGGVTWEEKYSTVTQEEGTRHLLKWDNTLWVGAGRDVYSSTDNGTTWSLSTLDVRASSLDSADGHLYISGNDQYGFFGLYRSADAGATWEQLLSTQETNIPASGFVKVANTLYVSGFKALYFSDDEGLTWTTYLLPHSFNLYQESFLAHVDDALFVSCGDGILFTADRGATWERRNIDYKNHNVIQIATTNQSVISYSETNGVYISQDNGSTWNSIPDQDEYRPRQIYAYNNTIFASYLLGVYKSEDEGQTWQKIFTLTDDIPGPHNIPHVHLTGWRESLIYSTYKGTYFSTDMGKSWDLWPVSTFGTDAFIVKGFMQGDTVVLATQEDFFYTFDLGKNWQKRMVPEGMISSYYSITDMLFDDSSITMSTLFGLYKSPDLGITWKRSECIPERIIFDMEQVGEALILSTFTGVYASQNGVEWYAVRDGLHDARTMAMVIKDNNAFVGTWGKSVWKRPVADFLTPGVILITADEVPKPLVEYNCSIITAVNSNQKLQVKWYKDGVVIPNQTSTKLQTNGEGIYQVSFENSCDLKVSDEITMSNTQAVDPEIYNVITANGDNKNDFYFVDANLIGSRLSVYNRWGEIVYSDQSYKNNWSPTQISAGQYFYAIDNDCLGSFKGVLTILKP